jgi:hypothetical protein
MTQLWLELAQLVAVIGRRLKNEIAAGSPESFGGIAPDEVASDANSG